MGHFLNLFITMFRLVRKTNRKYHNVRNFSAYSEEPQATFAKLAGAVFVGFALWSSYFSFLISRKLKQECEELVSLSDKKIELSKTSQSQTIVATDKNHLDES